MSEKIMTIILANNGAYDESIKVLPVEEDFLGKYLSLVYSVNSKVTLEVHIDPKHLGAPEIEHIYFNPGTCLQTCSTVKDYNSKLSKNEILINVLGYKRLDDDSELDDYVSGIFNNLKGTDNIGKIKEILGTLGMENYISRLTVKIGPNAAFKESIEDNHVYFRFVKYTLVELFDANLFSLKLAGLFGADGIVILGSLASDKNLYLDKDIYNTSELFKAFKSTQLFYVQSSANLIEHIDNNDYTDLFISSFENGLTGYRFETYFNRTFDSLVSLRVLNYEKTRGYYSEYPFFKQKSISYILPVSSSLVDYISSKNSFALDDLLEAKDFNTLLELNTRVQTDILRKINTLEQTTEAIIKDGVAKELFLHSYEKHKDYLKADSENYGYGFDVCKYVHPQFDDMYSNGLLELFEAMQDSEVPILGEKGGITTRKNNKYYKYPATVISATSGYLWLEYIIDHIDVSDNLRTKSGNLVFGDYEDDFEMQTFLIKYILKRFLLKRFAGYERIYGYLIVDKYITKQAIEMYRNEPYRKVKENPFAAVMDKIVYLFAQTLEDGDK